MHQLADGADQRCAIGAIWHSTAELVDHAEVNIEAVETPQELLGKCFVNHAHDAPH
jgi:hypothetical protein